MFNYNQEQLGVCSSLGTPYVNFEEILMVMLETLIWLIILIDCLRNIFPGSTDRGYYGKRDHNVQRLTPHPQNSIGRYLQPWSNSNCPPNGTEIPNFFIFLDQGVSKPTHFQTVRNQSSNLEMSERRKKD